MPRSQVAVIDNFDLGLPAAAAQVIEFKLRPDHGGVIQLRFENSEGENDATLSVQVSADGSSWNATSAANNLEVITNVSIPRKTFNDYELLLRPGIDNYVRVTGSGRTRVQLQLRHGGLLDIEDLANAAPTA